MTRSILLILLLSSSFLFTTFKQSKAPVEWPEYQGGPERNQYSPLHQIDTSNVQQLIPVWEYHTGDSGQIQCNPIIIDGILYGMSATALPFALDASTGKEKWRLNPEGESNALSTSRGLVYWQDNDDKRILYTNESWLYAVDAGTGQPIVHFGDSGRISLKAGLGATARDKFVISNTPGTVFEDLIIMPLRVSEGPDAAPGYIQAFNIRTGEVAWVFHTIPHPGEEGYDTWPPKIYENTLGVGAANNWAGMAIDRDREIVYVPTGSASMDFYGGNRKGKNEFANTLLALNARDGSLIWHYQLVHHDILDRDPPAPPNLLTVMHNGKEIDAVAQITKQGYVFLFDRENGTPLFDIEEVPVPASDIPGEEAWPTQPKPVLPEPFARQNLTVEDINPWASNQEALQKNMGSIRSEGAFTPLSTQGTIIFPGLDGGAEWGGAATDPEGIIYINSNEMPWLISLEENIQQPDAGLSMGESLYASLCSACHGKDRRGNTASGFPSLDSLENRMTEQHSSEIIRQGKGMMPAFTSLTEEEHDALINYLYGKETFREPGLDVSKDPNSPYRISGYTKFLDKDGYPAVTPPWGTLNAIDLNTGEFKWKIVYGEYPELVEKGIPQTGAESYGGPVVTAGGLLFIAGTKDRKFRAYNKQNGILLWEVMLPAAAFATPSTYEVNGRQFVVIACGGTKLGAEKGDSYIAFALPEKP